MILSKHTIEYVAHKHHPRPTPTNKERWQEWMAKWAMANEPLGNSFFRFAPIFDPPYNEMPTMDNYRGF